MKKFTLLLCAIFLSSIGFSQNLVVNGDMESWDSHTSPTGWTHVQSAAQSTNAYNGLYSVQHTGGTNDLGQTISGIQPGRTYNVSLRYQVEEGTGDGTDARIWSNWTGNGSTIYHDESVGSDVLRGPNDEYFDNNNHEWTQYSVDVTAPANADGFYFEVRTYRDAVVYYDDFSLTCLDCSDDFYCPELAANIGDTCDDGNPNTINDVIGEDCECAGTPVVIGDECGFENFDNANIGTGYSDGSFVGNDGIEWFYGHSRDQEDFGIDGNGIMLRNASDSYLEATIPNGIGEFTFQYRKAFTGSATRQLELLVNGAVVETSEEFGSVSGADATVYTFTHAVNMEGEVTIRIKNVGTASTNKQTVIDNISWTCFGDEEPVEYDCPALEANFGDACDDGDDMTENDMINENCECEGTPVVIFDCPELEANFNDACDDGNPNTINDVIGEDCECAGEPVVIGDECGFENFDNAELTASYSDGSFVGNDGITWTYVQSRNENGDENNSGIAGNAIMLRRVSDNSKITSGTISGGIGSFSVKVYKGFTGSGNRQVELFINGISRGTSTRFNDYDEHTFTVDNINIEGDFVLEIRNITSNQVIIDDITWTCFGDEEPVEYECPALEANIGEACDDNDETTENDMINENCECEGTPVVVFECPELEANIGDTCDDNDETTENDIVNENCECEGTPVVVFECPELEANIGDTCDDNDETTENDIINENCECEGTPIVTFDCPELEADFGDACDDSNEMTENDMINENCECEGTPIVVEPEECVAPTEVTIERLSPTSIAISTNVEVWSMYVDIFNNPPSFNSRTKSHWTKLRNTYINNNLVPNRTYYLWFRTNCPNNEVSEYTELYTVEPWAVARSSSNPNATINQVHEQLVNVDVFPNPTSDELNISGINAQQIRIFDSNGTAIFSGRVDNNQLNLRQLQTGVYRMVITDENNREHAVQVIKQ